MGVDVNLYVEGEVTDEELGKANAYIAERSDDHYGGSHVGRDEFSDTPRVERKSMSRYYGPYYERGDWPHIFGEILLMQAAFPDRTVHYGGDNQDDCPGVTPDMLAELWAHFLGADGNNYRKFLDAALAAART